MIPPSLDEYQKEKKRQNKAVKQDQRDQGDGDGLQEEDVSDHSGERPSTGRGDGGSVQTSGVHLNNKPDWSDNTGHDQPRVYELLLQVNLPLKSILSYILDKHTY